MGLIDDAGVPDMLKSLKGLHVSMYAFPNPQQPQPFQGR